MDSMEKYFFEDQDLIVECGLTLTSEESDETSSSPRKVTSILPGDISFLDKKYGYKSTTTLIPHAGWSPILPFFLSILTSIGPRAEEAPMGRFQLELIYCFTFIFHRRPIKHLYVSFF